MTLNQGYSYRKRLEADANEHTVLSYLVTHYKHSDKEIWTARLTHGEVLLDGEKALGDEPLQAGQMLIWNRPPWQEKVVARRYGLVHQDKDLLVVTKPSGLPTLPGGGFLANTLLAVVKETYPEANPLHRLGRATSGLVIFSRNPEAARVLSRDWATVSKTYRALAQGVAQEDYYEITAPIGPVPHPHLGTVFSAVVGGKRSRSNARVLERRAKATLFEIDLVTGRPHQIRIHLASIGHPLEGEPLYAAGAKLLNKPGLPGDGGYFLHAERLRFKQPLSGEWLELHAPAPAELLLSGAEN